MSDYSATEDKVSRSLSHQRAFAASASAIGWGSAVFAASSLVTSVLVTILWLAGTFVLLHRPATQAADRLIKWTTRSIIRIHRKMLERLASRVRLVFGAAVIFAAAAILAHQ